MRRMLHIFLLFYVLGLICMPATAATGTIRVHIAGEGKITLYRVGVLERDHYLLSDEHGGGEVTFDDVLRPELAARLASRASGGISRETKDGVAEFSGLSEGLYLAVRTAGDGDFEPVLISLPWDGDTWYLDIKSEKTEQLIDIPQTGDRSIVVVSSWIMCAAMIGLLVIGSRKKY